VSKNVKIIIMHPNSKLLFEKYAKPIFKDNIKVLEIGPDKSPSTYKKAVNNNTINWKTIDIKSFGNFKLDYTTTNEYKFPIPDNTFDIVVSGNVIEHVKKIWVWIKEVTRICKKGGHVITIVPVSWFYHPFPVDCWRIYAEGMKALYEEAGLTAELCKTETLEVVNYKRLIPGRSCKPGKYEFKLFFRKLLRRKIVCAFDTIAIGKK